MAITGPSDTPPLDPHAEALQRDIAELMAAYVVRKVVAEYAGRPPPAGSTLQAIAAGVREDTLAEVLRGLRSERDSPQLRAIIASVEALRRPAPAAPDASHAENPPGA